MIKISTPQEYFEFVKSCSLALVHFWAEWNGQDYAMKNRLGEIESNYKDFVCFGTVNIELEEMFQICRDINIINVPTLAYYKNDELIETVIGLNQEIKERLDALI